MTVTAAPQKAKGPSKLLVPLVLAVGALTGLALSYLVPLPYGPGPFGFGFADRLRDLIILHMVLSTVAIALLVTLILVYARVYAATGARFALGILIVMFALLLQSLFQYPILLGVGRIYVGFGFNLSTADIFTIVAYTIFLYLSLE